MSVLAFSAILWLGSFAAGTIGALTGLGGGVVIVPLLVLGFHVDLPAAFGASLVSVIATSSGASSAYLREGFSNIRVAMLLEVATTVGALSGAAFAARVPAATLQVLFGIVLLASAYLSRYAPAHAVRPREDRLSRYLKLDASYPSSTGPVAYSVHNIPAGFGLMFLAGSLSGLLGIGSGALKVLAMDRVMRLPLKVSTTTSNFMIGVTAAAGASVYLGRGDLHASLTMPIVLGALPGALLGARLLPRMGSTALRRIFLVVIALLGGEMILQGIRAA